jgi:ribonuclease HI
LLRRAGWGTVIRFPGLLTLDDTRIARGAFGSIGGPRQTVNRAELRALVQALRMTSGALRYVTDSSFVHRGFTQLAEGRASFRHHSGMWAEVREHCEDRDVRVFKLESHLEDHPERLGGTPWSWVAGNAQADVLADEAADEARADIQTREEVNRKQGHAAMVLRHHSLVLANVLEVDPRARPPRAPPVKKATFSERCEDSAHTVGKWGRALRCTTCREVSVLHSARQKRWLASPCRGDPLAPQGGGPADRLPVHVVNGAITDTHDAAYLAGCGCWICLCCGGEGAEQLRSLSGTCRGLPTAAGLAALSRARRGLAPGATARARAFNLGHLRARRRKTR